MILGFSFMWFLLLLSAFSAISPYIPLFLLLVFIVFLYCVPIIWSEYFSLVGSIIYWTVLTGLLVWRITLTYKRDTDIRPAIKGLGFLILVVGTIILSLKFLPQPAASVVAISVLFLSIGCGIFLINKTDEKNNQMTKGDKKLGIGCLSIIFLMVMALMFFETKLALLIILALLVTWIVFSVIIAKKEDENQKEN